MPDTSNKSTMRASLRRQEQGWVVYSGYRRELLPEHALAFVGGGTGQPSIAATEAGLKGRP